MFGEVDAIMGVIAAEVVAERMRCCADLCWRCANGEPVAQGTDNSQLWWHATVTGRDLCGATLIRARGAKEEHA